MSTDTTATRRTAVTLLGALTLAATLVATAAPGALGADACQVRNVTQDTHGTSFKVMVKAAVDGDRLTVRGTCEGGVTIGSDITIKGIGDPRPVLTGRHRHRVLRVGRSTLVLRHLVITDGAVVDRGGGGIMNRGTLTLIDSVVLANTTNAGGGGIENNGTLTLTDSTVKGNTAGFGLGINNYGILTLTDSVVRGNTPNTAGTAGGGIRNVTILTLTDSTVKGNGAFEGGGIDNQGTATLTGSVVRGNTASEFGGGIANYGTLTLRRSSTVTANTAGKVGGGIWNDDDPDDAGTVILRSGSSVTDNTPDDCHGTTAC